MSGWHRSGGPILREAALCLPNNSHSDGHPTRLKVGEGPDMPARLHFLHDLDNHTHSGRL
jgi:hypothetical protein